MLRTSTRAVAAAAGDALIDALDASAACLQQPDDGIRLRLAYRAAYLQAQVRHPGLTEALFRNCFLQLVGRQFGAYSWEASERARADAVLGVAVYALDR